MELHNTVEDKVLPKVDEIFDTIAAEGNPSKICTCSQCRIDTACYVLNRIKPFYVVSSRGAVRITKETLEHQQKEADITALIYEGLRTVYHNLRPNFSHDSAVVDHRSDTLGKPVFNIPAITGRLFNGSNFEPVSGVNVSLVYNGKCVKMKDGNWQNPVKLDSHTEGCFSFWPALFLAEQPGEQTVFEFTLSVESEEYETLHHVFGIPVISEIQTIQSFSLGRNFKLSDLYLFPPGEDKQNRSLD